VEIESLVVLTSEQEVAALGLLKEQTEIEDTKSALEFILRTARKIKIAVLGM
jgi:hypothetical protein